MELFLVAIAHPFFYKQAKAQILDEAWASYTEQIFWGCEGVRLAGKWGELFIRFQTSPLRGDETLVWGHEMTESVLGGASPPGLALINWGLVRFVGLSVLKWASVSSSPSPRRLAWLPCCNSSSFPGFLSHVAFHSQRNDLKRKRLLPSPLLEVTLWAMMWWRRTRDNILTCTLLV